MVNYLLELKLIQWSVLELFVVELSSGTGTYTAECVGNIDGETYLATCDKLYLAGVLMEIVVYRLVEASSMERNTNINEQLSHYIWEYIRNWFCMV